MAIEATVTETLAATPETVWAWFADPVRLPTWVPGVAAVEVEGGGALVPWARLRIRLTDGNVVEGEVVTVEAPVRLELRAEGEGIPGDGRIESEVRIEAAPEGSRVTIRARAEIGGLFLLMAGSIRSKAETHMRRALQRLAGELAGG